MGCSLIGFTIGAISDGAHTPAGTLVSLDDIRNIEIGTDIVITRLDSLIVEGEFAGVRQKNAKQYRAQYLQVGTQVGDSAHLPLPGDSITYALITNPEKLYNGMFLGVDPGILYVTRVGRKVPVIDLVMLKRNQEAAANLSALQWLIKERKLPLLTVGVLVKVRGDTVEVPIASMARIAENEVPHGKLTGTLIGGVIDVIVIAAASNQAHQDCNNRNQSCNNSNQQSCNAK